MRRTHVFNLANEDTSDFIRAGSLTPEKGQGVIGLRVKLTVPIKNSSADTNKALTDADKAKVLDSFRTNFAYGKDLKRTPFKNLSFKALRTLQRYLFGVEVFGYSDTSTGFGKQIAFGTTQNLVVHLLIPTCQIWMVKELVNLYAMGRSQCATVECEFKWISGVALGDSDMSIDGTVKIEVYPEVAPVKTDRWTWLPEYVESNVHDFRETLAEGFPLLLAERSAAQASTSFTKLNVKVDEHEIDRDVDPATMISRYKQALALTSGEDISDTWTLLYWIQAGAHLRNLASGSLFIEQPNNDLSNMQLAYLYVPVVDATEVFANVKHIADNLRKKAIKAVNVLAHEKVQVPHRLAAFQPFSIFDSDDAEYEKFPGVACDKGGQPDVFLPKTGVEDAQAKLAKKKGAGETRAAKDVVLETALFVPGAASSARGYDRGGPVLASIHRTLGA